MTLPQLGQLYETDKLQHGYLEFYEKTLPEQPKRMLEIGCYKGASARMWKHYFPNTEIHVLDLFEENPMPDIEGVLFHKGNQCDWLLLEQLRKFDFDVIIDDGSHNSRDQMITFFGLMHANCNYYIEDTHCADEDFYRQGLPFEFTVKNIIDEALNFYSIECDPLTRVYKSKNITLVSFNNFFHADTFK